MTAATKAGKELIQLIEAGGGDAYMVLLVAAAEQQAHNAAVEALRMDYELRGYLAPRDFQRHTVTIEDLP